MIFILQGKKNHFMLLLINPFKLWVRDCRNNATSHSLTVIPFPCTKQCAPQRLLSVYHICLPWRASAVFNLTFSENKAVLTVRSSSDMNDWQMNSVQFLIKSRSRSSLKCVVHDCAHTVGGSSYNWYWI